MRFRCFATNSTVRTALAPVPACVFELCIAAARKRVKTRFLVRCERVWPTGVRSTLRSRARRLLEGCHPLLPPYCASERTALPLPSHPNDRLCARSSQLVDAKPHPVDEQHRAAVHSRTQFSSHPPPRSDDQLLPRGVSAPPEIKTVTSTFATRYASAARDCPPFFTPRASPVPVSVVPPGHPDLPFSLHESALLGPFVVLSSLLGRHSLTANTRPPPRLRPREPRLAIFCPPLSPALVLAGVHEIVAGYAANR